MRNVGVGTGCVVIFNLSRLTKQYRLFQTLLWMHIHRRSYSTDLQILLLRTVNE